MPEFDPRLVHLLGKALAEDFGRKPRFDLATDILTALKFLIENRVLSADVTDLTFNASPKTQLMRCIRDLTEPDDRGGHSVVLKTGYAYFCEEHKNRRDHAWTVYQGDVSRITIPNDQFERHFDPNTAGIDRNSIG